MSRRPRAVLVLVAAGLVAACSGVKSLSFPTPPATAPVPPGQTTTTVAPDLTGISLSPVASVAPTTVALFPGGASLSGIVIGPLGVVGGATVLVERLVGDSVGAKAVSTAADGTWKLSGIRGGRYRIRAWHVPDLALTTPQITLLGATENQNVSLNVMAYNASNASAAVAPPLVVAQISTLVVQVTAQTVGSDGVVRVAPLPAATVVVTAAPNIAIAGTNPGITDAGGRVTLQLACAAVGPAGLTATVNSGNSFPLTVADCAALPPPTAPTATTLRPPTPSSVR